VLVCWASGLGFGAWGLLEYWVRHLGMDGAEVAILEEMHQEILHGLLDRHERLRCVPEGLRRHLVGDLPHQPGEWCFPEKQLGALLEFPDLLQRQRAWPIPPLLFRCTRGFRAQGSGLGARGSGLRVQGAGCMVQSFRVLGFRDLEFLSLRVLVS